MKCKEIFSFLCCCFMLLPSTVATAQHKVNLTVGSYNVRYDNEGDRKAGNGWDRRVPVLTSLIEYIDYDVFGAQEVLSNQLDDLKKLLPAYDYVGVGRDDGKAAGEFAPIFFKRDKFRKLKNGVFWLSETPDRPSKGWDAALPRICTWVLLQDIASGQKLWYFNLHMDHVGMKAREESSKLVIRKMRELAQHDAAILTGDFNVDQHNEIYNLLQKSDFIHDSFTLAPAKFAWNGTFNAYDNSLWTDSRIDHVFVTATVNVKHYAVLTESYRSKKENHEEVKKGDFPRELSFKQYDTRLPSDHFPVVVKLSL